MIQVRPSDTPYEVCEMSVGPQEAESACDNAAVSAGLPCSDGFRGGCSIVCSLCAYPAVGWGSDCVRGQVGRGQGSDSGSPVLQHRLGGFPGHSVWTLSSAFPVI